MSPECAFRRVQSIALCGKRITLPVTYALELGKLPTPELQAKAYGQMQALRQPGLQKPNEYLNSLKHIVARRLKPEEQPDPAASPSPTSAVKEF